MEIAIGTDFKPLDFMETHVVIMAGGMEPSVAGQHTGKA